LIASQTHILLRGDGYFSNPELMQLILDEGNADFIFGVTGNAVLPRRAGQTIQGSRAAPPGYGLPGQINTGTGKSIRAQVCQRLCPAGRKPAMRASP